MRIPHLGGGGTQVLAVLPLVVQHRIHPEQGICHQSHVQLHTQAIPVGHCWHRQGKPRPPAPRHKAAHQQTLLAQLLTCDPWSTWSTVATPLPLGCGHSGSTVSCSWMCPSSGRPWAAHAASSQPPSPPMGPTPQKSLIPIAFALRLRTSLTMLRLGAAKANSAFKQGP